MTSSAAAGLAAAVLVLSGAVAVAAEPSYPFEGTWIQPDRPCNASATRVRTYTARDVTSPLGRCAIRRIAGGGATFELLEECRRGERPQTVTETIRLQGADAMTLKRQLVRLKIPRPVKYARCTIAAPGGTRPPAAPPHPAPPTMPRRAPVTTP